MSGALGPVADWPVPAAAAAIVRGSHVEETYGPIDMAFRIASVAKLLTTYAALVAVEEGSVELDDPVGQPGCTLRHLLSHAGGYGFNDPQPLQRPGRTRAYSNTGIELAASHVAARTDTPFADYCRLGVFEPLGMANTTMRGSPAHGVWSTVADMALFLAELQRPALIAASTLASAVEVQFPGLRGLLPGVGRFDPLDWSLGFERNFSKPGHWAGTKVSPQTYGHFGGTGTMLWFDPILGVGVVALANREFDEWGMAAFPVLSDSVALAYTAR